MTATKPVWCCRYASIRLWCATLCHKLRYPQDSLCPQDSTVSKTDDRNIGQLVLSMALLLLPPLGELSPALLQLILQLSTLSGSFRWIFFALLALFADPRVFAGWEADAKRACTSFFRSLRFLAFEQASPYREEEDDGS